MTRNQLKVIIKECLVEMLTDGMKSSTVSESQLSKRQPPTQTPRQPVRQNVKSQHENVIKQVTNDPVMAAIFADTMQTTLVEQVSADRNKQLASIGGDVASRAMASVEDPTEVFGEDMTAKWNAAAFAPRRGSSVMNDFANDMLSMNQVVKKDS